MRHDFTALTQRDKAILMGLFLSRFDKDAVKSLGFTGPYEAFNVLGYSIGIAPNSIKGYRDEFDPYFPNPRKGRHKRALRGYCKDIMDKAAELDFNGFQRLINSFVLDEYVDIKDIKRDNIKTKERKFSESRMLTGKAAENYFVLNYQNISPFQKYTLTDTTNKGCGFDYKLSLDGSNFYVEVKGINERQGSILMTELEYDRAEKLLEHYCLFVVSNFKKSPIHQMFFNPLYDDRLLFTKRERPVTQISYTSNIIGI